MTTTRSQIGRTIRVQDDDWKRLNNIAKQLGMTRHKMISLAIMDILTQNAKTPDSA